VRVPVRRGVGAGAADHARVRGGAGLGRRALFMLARQAGGDCDAALGGAAGRTMAAANREFDQLAIAALLNTFSL